jgi:hypothetical protein
MSGLLWIILISFVAGSSPDNSLGRTSLLGSFSPPPSVSPELFFQPGSARPLAGIGQIKAPAIAATLGAIAVLFIGIAWLRTGSSAIRGQSLVH